MLTREQILGSPANLPREEVQAFGGTVIVQGLTAIERDGWESSCLRREGSGQRLNVVGMRAKLVVLVVVDESGQRIFREGDALAIGGKSAKDVDRVFAVGQRLSGISDDDLRVMEKNSVSG